MGSAAAGLIGLSLLFIAIVCRMGWGIKTKAFASLPRTVIVVLIMPGLLMSASFYALAMHMHSSLGGWPKSIGDEGFPPALIWHADATFWYFESLILAMIFAWPFAVAACAIVSRLRRFIPHLCLFAGSLALHFVLMLLGPSPFLNWWWD